MDEKGLGEFQQELENGKEKKKDEKQSGECRDLLKKDKVYGKPHRSCSFVRNWRGWLIGDE